jgi:hypothetical protein
VYRYICIWYLSRYVIQNICLYMHIQTYIYIYVYIYIHTRIGSFEATLKEFGGPHALSDWVYIYMYICINTCIFMYIHTYLRCMIYVHLCTYVYSNMNIYLYIKEKLAAALRPLTDGVMSLPTVAIRPDLGSLFTLGIICVVIFLYLCLIGCSLCFTCKG